LVLSRRLCQQTVYHRNVGREIHQLDRLLGDPLQLILLATQKLAQAVHHIVVNQTFVSLQLLIHMVEESGLDPCGVNEDDAVLVVLYVGVDVLLPNF